MLSFFVTEIVGVMLGMDGREMFPHLLFFIAPELCQCFRIIGKLFQCLVEGGDCFFMPPELLVTAADIVPGMETASAIRGEVLQIAITELQTMPKCCQGFIQAV